MTTTIINAIKEICNPFNLCDLSAYTLKLDALNELLDNFLTENLTESERCRRDAVIIVISEVDTIKVCIEHRFETIFVCWDKLKEMIPYFETILNGDIWEIEYDAFCKMDNIFYKQGKQAVN